MRVDVHPYPVSANEDARLHSLSEYGLTADDPQIDVGSLLRLASSLFDVPTVLLSIVERHRQIFAARLGLDVCETNRSVSFCAHALDRTDALFVADATRDLRFCQNPLVTGPPFIRFYAGHPLIAPSGQAIGTLCLIDSKPRAVFSDQERANLKSIVDLVLDKLEMRRLERARQEGQDRFEHIASTSPDSIICADHKGLIRFWNVAAESMFGFSADEALDQPIDLIVPERMRGGHGGGLKRVAGGAPPTLVGTSVELPAQKKDGSEFPIELSLSMWSEQGLARFGAIIRDISERRANEERLYRLAHLDTLTSLPNRMVVREELGELVGKRAPSALLAIDLDGFKAVNDTLGHSAGDQVLVEVARRLISCVEPGVTVGRLGGDEFAIILSEANDPILIAKIADCIISKIHNPFIIDGSEVVIGASIGVALHPLHGEHAEDLFSAADLALYAAKSDGRHCRRFFDPGMRRAAVLKQTQESELRRALENGEFELFYQPQVRANDNALVGAEALLRWRHPKRGLQSPLAFLPTLETGALAASVGTWVLETACRQTALWRANYHPDFRIGVNLFGAQFRAGDLAATVRRTLEETELPTCALELEITENIILRHDDAMIGPLRELRDAGVGIAFDDYGTGYASLSMLKRYPLSRLKVDQTFVRNMCDSPTDAAIVRAVIQLGKAFNLEVIAEGVETDAQREMLARKGCDELQGYLFGRPEPAQQFAVLFMNGLHSKHAALG